MAKSLLDGVNQVLIKTKVLDNDTGLLATLTDSARQVYIDTAIQVLNEVLDDLYSPVHSDVSKPKQTKKGELLLATGSRTAKLASSAISLRRETNLVDRTNTHTIYVLDEDGFAALITADLEQDDTGLPSSCAIDPTGERQIMFDRTPTAAEDGNTYTYYYDRDLELASAGDEFPFNNAIFRALIPAAAEMWKFHQHQEASDTVISRSMARAAVLLSGLSQSNSWNPNRGGMNITDPLGG